MYQETLSPETLQLFTRLSSEKFVREFYLAGGTALVLHLGHRISIDLDFFTINDLKLDYLRPEP